jgi:hypothetical protein
MQVPGPPGEVVEAVVVLVVVVLSVEADTSNDPPRLIGWTHMMSPSQTLLLIDVEAC